MQAGGERLIRRDINLLESVPGRREGRARSAWWPLGTLALSVLLCTLGAVWLTVQQTRQDVALAAVAAEIDRLPQRSSAGETEHDEVALRAEAERLNAALRDWAEVGDGATVSQVLEGLAAATTDGVWLTRIRFEPSTGMLRLDGRTRDPKLLPAYLAALGRAPAFVGLPLRYVGVTRSDTTGSEAGAEFEFRIDSAGMRPAPDGGSAAAAVRSVETQP